MKEKWYVAAVAIVALAAGLVIGYAVQPEPETIVETKTIEVVPQDEIDALAAWETELETREAELAEAEPAVSIEEAADQYLRIVAPVNAAAVESEAYWLAGRYRDSARVMIEPDKRMIEDLAAAEWPGDVARLVEQMVELTKDEVAAYERVAGASNERQAEDSWWADVYPAQEARGAISSAIRVLLDLPQIN